MTGRIETRSGSLAAALGLVALPASEQDKRRSAALRMIRLTAKGDHLLINATTFGGSITIRVEAGAEGELALPLDQLAALVQHFPIDENIVLAADDHVAIVSASNSSFRLRVVPIADLWEPLVLGAETGRVEFDAKIARDLFARPAFAAADDVSQAYLSGIFLHGEGEDLVVVATDGVRLRRVTGPAPAILSKDRTLIIPN